MTKEMQDKIRKTTEQEPYEADEQTKGETKTSWRFTAGAEYAGDNRLTDRKNGNGRKHNTRQKSEDQNLTIFFEIWYFFVLNMITADLLMYLACLSMHVAGRSSEG